MIFKTILILNAIWFALGFHAFALRSKIFAKTMVPRELRSTPVFDMLTHTGKFMGGFNLAFCVLNVLILGYADVFPDASQHIILCSTFAVAHGSQFLANVPVYLDNQKGNGVWQVKGLMLFIFVVDFVMMVLNVMVVVLNLN